ncbi:MAG: hypothetical protein MJY89_07100 [Bacteroidales bacterium]|nr:hypothetical protein [Bacteroidales bacterium]
MVKFGLIGYPAAHSRSPKLFRELCNGQWEYDIIETPSFDEAWSKFIEGPYKAINVTAPFKEPAFAKADIKSPDCLKIKAANILVKTSEGIAAFNSDYLAVRELIARYSKSLPKDETDSGHACETVSVAVVGFGGAGKAAWAAAQDFCSPRLYRHDEIAGGVKADIIIYTLPKAVPGIDKLDCSILIEANYKDPCLAGLIPYSSTGHSDFRYVPGTEWLRLQAELGYPLMTEGKVTVSSGKF